MRCWSAAPVARLTGDEEGAVQTLDGEWAEDELAADAINYPSCCRGSTRLWTRLKLVLEPACLCRQDGMESGRNVEVEG